LCHSVPHTAAQLAKYMRNRSRNVRNWVAGINHLAWFLEFKWNGKDHIDAQKKSSKTPGFILLMMHIGLEPILCVQKSSRPSAIS